MKFDVIKNFTDKHTGKHYDIGSEYSCSKVRFDEIQKAGNFLKEVAVKEEPKKDVKTKIKVEE